MKNLNHTFAKGIIPVHVEKLKSFDGFYFDVEVNHIDESINYNPKDASASRIKPAEPKIEEEKEEVEEPVESPAKEEEEEVVVDKTEEEAPVKSSAKEEEEAVTKDEVAPSASEPVVEEEVTEPSGESRILQDNIETSYIPSTWKLGNGSKSFISVIAVFIRALIILIQIFLIALRPCLAKRNTMLWDSMTSFASSMFFLQLLLMTSLFSQNFGGALNHFLDEFLLKSTDTFFDTLTNSVSSYVDATSQEFKGAGYWKLSQNGYIASPLLEDWVAVLLILLTGLYMIIIPNPKINYDQATTSRSLYEMLKEVQTGVALSFMIPVNVSCVNCMYACISSGIWTFWGVISFISSILLLGYYVWFAKNIRTKINSDQDGNQYEISDIYYHHLNFDF